MRHYTATFCECPERVAGSGDSTLFSNSFDLSDDDFVRKSFTLVAIY